MDVPTGDLVCLHLAEYEPDEVGGPVPEAVTIRGIGDALEMGTNVVARTNLLSVMQRLREENLVRERVQPVESSGDPRQVYALTDRGRERAATVREAVRDRTVVVTNGLTEEVTLGEVDRYFEDAPLVRALARLTDDGTVPLERFDRETVVGRGDELSALEAAVDDLHARGSRAVLVTGVAGSGKTTLVEAFRERLADHDANPAVGVGACESDAGAPYRAFRQAFRDLPGGTDLHRLLDGVAAAPDGDPGAVGVQRRSLFADIADALRAVADERPVVLVVEDLHWAGRATVDLLAYLIENVTGWLYPVLFVVTARPGVLDPDHPASDLLDRFETDPHQRLTLDPVTAVDTRAILGLTLEVDSLPDEFVEAVHEHTGGNPLFVTEIAKHLLETGAVADGEGFPTSPETLPAPETVQRTVDWRLSSLDETGRAVLALGAAVGDSFSAEVLAAASDLPEPQLRDYVDLLVDASVWERDGDRLRFVHGVVRQSALDRLDPETYRETHRQVAAAIESVHGDDLRDHYAAVAHHYREAGATGEAIAYYRRAGDRAADVYAHELALEAYGEALALARERGDDVVALDVLESMAEIHDLLGDHGTAVDRFETVLEAAGTVDRRRRVARKLAERHRWWDEYDRAVEAADRGLSTGDERADTAEECRLLLAKADALANRGDMPEARELYDRALALARRLDDPGLRADALRGQASIVWRQTPAAIDDGTVATMEEAIDLLEESGDDAALADALEDMGVVYSYRGDLDRAIEYTERALERREAIGDRKGALGVRYNRAYQYVTQAFLGRVDPDEAMAYVDETAAEARSLGDRGVLARLEWIRGLLLWMVYHRFDAALETLEDATDRARELDLARWQLYGAKVLSMLELYAADDPRQAREYARRAVEIGRRAERPRDTAIGLVLLAAACRAAGEPAEALDHLEEALDLATDSAAPLQELSARVELVRIHLALDDVAAAREAVRRVETLVGDHAARSVGALTAPIQGGVLYPLVAAWGARPRLARAEGDLEGAIGGFEVAREAARDAGVLLLEVEFGHELGATLREAGEHDRARSVLAETRDRAADADVRHYRRQCQDELDRFDDE